MKLLGLSDGRPMGNSEVLLKEAMMGAEEVVSGLDVEVIRLQYLTIKPCIGCWKCTNPKLKEWRCVNEKTDHMSYLVKKLSEADGIIFSFPSYAITAPSAFFAIRDRLVPGRRNIKKKQKVGGYITVGGSDWINLCLPLVPIWLWTVMKTVDQMFVPFTATLGQVVLNTEAMARARKLGRNVGKAMKMPYDEVKYVGEAIKVSDAEVKYLSKTMEMPEDYIRWVTEEEDHCPICHSNLLQLRGKHVRCAVCDVKGTIKIVGDKITVTYDEEELKKVRAGPIEGARHGHLVQHSIKLYEEKKEEIRQKVQKYMEYGNITAPPTLPGQKPVKLVVDWVDRQAIH
jgi:multimeric flavodoxin WrbA